MVDFKRIIDHDRSDRGWTVYRVIAKIDGNEVGHITFSNISTENYRKWYPSALYYAAFHQGWCDRRGMIDNLTSEDIKNLAWHASCQGWSDSYQTANILHEHILNMSEVQLRALKKSLDKFCYNRYRVEIKNFKARFINNPVVDYICVEPELRRQGIGTQLYFEAGRWLAEMGMELRASTCQSHYAEAVWKKFLKQGVAYKSGKWIKLKIENFNSKAA